MTLPLILVFLAGIANFAMHRWMLESGHPIVEVATGPFRRTFGRHATYVLEFALLVGALTLTEGWWLGGLMLYGIYTVLNATTIAWLEGPPQP